MHTPTPVILDGEARKKILKGTNVVYEAVRRTMGPQGGNVLLYGLYSRPYRLTNDGYTVAGIIELKDPHEKLAAAAIQDAAQRTNMRAGDATTCTVVLTGAGLNVVIPEIEAASGTAEFERSLKRSENYTKRGVMDIKRDLLKTRDFVIEQLKLESTPIKDLADLQRIATVSVEDEELGKIISEMAWKVGTGGYIDIVEGFNGQIETETIEGSRFPAKIPAKVFVNKPERYEMEMLNAPVLLTNYVVDKEFLAIALAKLVNLQHLIIIAPEFKESALVTLAQINKKNNDLVYAPVKAPSLRTVQFEDVAAFTGAKFINKDVGDKPDTVTNDDLGFLAKLIVKDAETREDATALGGHGINIPARIEVLKEQMAATREEGQRELLRRRIAGLASAVGVIKVSKDSEAETYYWKKKIEDAVLACKAALEEGYIPGGGLTLKKISEMLPATDLLKSVLMAPYNQIQENAGGIEIGEDIIDSTKGIRCAVEHAISIVASLATVRVIIPEEYQKSPAEGYEDIALALWAKVGLEAKLHGIALDNEAEIALDTMAHHDARLRHIVD